MKEISFGSDILDGRYVDIPRGRPQSTEPDSNGWKRVLYEYNPSIPDNYTSSQFLSSLCLDCIDMKAYAYIPTLIRAAVAFSFHSFSIPIFFLVFYKFSSGTTTTDLVTVIVSATVMLLGGYICREHWVSLTLGQELSRRPRQIGKRRKFVRDISRAILLFVSLFVVSPMIRSLTITSWARRTIIGFGCFVFMLHVIFHDYEFMSRGRSKMDDWYIAKGDKARVINRWKQVDSPIGLNAVLLSSILLGSRLEKTEAVFAFIFFSITTFAYLPFLLKWVFQVSRGAYLRLVVPVLLAIVASILHVHLGRLVTMIYLVVYGVVVICGPALLILCLPLKRAIKGPWDIAHVKPRVEIETPVVLTTMPRVPDNVASQG